MCAHIGAHCATISSSLGLCFCFAWLCYVHVGLNKERIVPHSVSRLCLGLLILCGVPGLSHAATVGEAAPAFATQSASGEQVSLADYAGHLVVLEWSNYNCPFVRKHYDSGNIPDMQERYTGKGVVWLTVMSSAPGKQGYFEPEALQALNKEHGNKATHVLRDADGTIGRLYDATSTPHLFVIDRDGTLAYAGAIDSIASAVKEDIEQAENYVVSALDSLLAGEKVKTPVSRAYGCSIKY